MPNYLKYLCFLVFLLLNLNACQDKNTTQSEQTLPQDASPSPLQYAQNFKITEFDDFKVLTLLKPFTDSPDSLRYVLYPKNQAKPKGFEDATFIQTPIEKIVVLSHSHIAFLQKLGLENHIVGINESAYLPEIPFKNKLKTGQIKDVSNAQGVLNLEEILALEPDLLVFSSATKESFLKNQILTEANIPMVFNGEWLETSPLGRAEWLLMMGLFFEKDTQAKEIFKEMSQSYEIIRQKTDSIRSKPTVLWEVPYKDTWYVPGGKSYIAQLIKDAGGEYLWKNDQNIASLALDFETVYAKAQQADYWISMGLIKTKNALLGQDARFTDFKAYQQGRLYNHNRTHSEQGGSLYLMEGVVNPHWVLGDLVKILHPKIFPTQQFKYYQKIE